MRVTPSGSAESRDAIVAALFANGARAIVDEESAILTYVPSDDVDRMCSAVRTADAAAAIVSATVEDQDWTVAWRAHLTLQRVGDLTVAPPWLAHSLDPARS
jgi:ribosomal protein L11 methylase PrmA